MSTPRRDLPPDVIDALQRGEIVAALKRLLAHRTAAASKPRPATGAKAPPALHGAAQVPPEVDEALRRGDRFEAVKRLRAATGLGLKEAKDLVDARHVAPLAGRKGLAPGEVPRTRGGFWWLVAAAVVLWALWRMWQRGVWV